MERILIKNLADNKGSEVTVCASADVVRQQGKMAFFDF
jgi:hypothetical protein